MTAARVRKNCLNVLVATGCCLASQPPAPAELPGNAPAAVHFTADEDRARLMKLLHIDKLRQGVSGDPKSPNAANYDEAKAGPRGKLPDPLVMKNGRKVTTAKMWWAKRRAEIVEDFDREIYGRVPRVIPKVNWELIFTSRDENYGLPIITMRRRCTWSSS
jgi:hypothetical protein